MSKILTAKDAERAIELAEPLIAHLVLEGVVNRPHLHVIVAMRDDSISHDLYQVLARKSFGQNWEHAYDEIAKGKTEISARTGLTSREAQMMYPELLVSSDIMFWGNAVSVDLIVSCSGVQPWFDEAISKTILGLCQALAHDRVQALRQEASGDTFDS